MRSKFRTLLVTLVATTAVGAIGVASASAALPEFVPAEGGKFPIALASGTTTIETRFSVVGGGGSLLPQCAGLTASGSITGAKAASLTLELENCFAGSHHECHSKGATKARIVLAGKGTLVYIEKATTTVGVVLELPAVEVQCEGLVLNIKAPVGVVIPITPLNVTTSKLNLRLKGELGKQEHLSFENEKGEVNFGTLEINAGAGYTKAAISLNEELALKAVKPIKINA